MKIVIGLVLSALATLPVSLLCHWISCITPDWFHVPVSLMQIGWGFVIGWFVTDWWLKRIRKRGGW